MPQLNGGGGDELGANDEMISFKDEGEQEDKISENVSAERDLDDVKSSLVNESENNSSSSDSEVSHKPPRVDRRMDVVVDVGKITLLFCFSLSLILSFSKTRGVLNQEPILKVMREPESISPKVTLRANCCYGMPI